MKIIFIVLTSFLVACSGCSSSENTASKENIQIVSATFDHWSEPPSGNSNVPERGTNLTLTIKNWPDNLSPDYIIYENRKSLSATITDTVNGHSVITGKIIRSSARLPKTSETVSKSNRLVYSTNNGGKAYIEIKNWESSSK